MNNLPAVPLLVEYMSIKLVLLGGNIPTNMTHIVIGPPFSLT